MMFSFKGLVRKFGDNIDTDIIAPNKWMHEDMTILKQHAFEAVRPDFYKQINPGDILVAGRNFGYGSHREQANTVIKEYGLPIIIAESIARIYFRNCIAIGLPAIILPGVSEFLNEADNVAITLSRDGGILERDGGYKTEIPPLPEVFFKMIEQGGILPMIKALL